MVSNCLQLVIFLVLVHSIIPTILAQDEMPRESHLQLQLMNCTNMTGFYLEATLDVVSYYMSNCTTSQSDQISSSLYNHFEAYSAFDPNVGAIEIVPTSSHACSVSAVRRNLNEAEITIGRDTTEASPVSHRKLYQVPLLRRKIPARCRTCRKDNRDGRRLIITATTTITIRFITDGSPEESSYAIMKNKTALYKSPLFTKPKTEYVQTYSLEPNTRGYFVMKDSAGDGICCLNGKGSFEVFAGPNVNGELLLREESNFGFRKVFFFRVLAPVADDQSSSALNIPALETKYSEYLTYYIQQAFHNNPNSCVHNKFPTVSVNLKEISFAEAMRMC